MSPRKPGQPLRRGGRRSGTLASSSTAAPAHRERLDVRRVELTHDVLCGVVKSSRDLRRERESREATERLLAEQNSRECRRAARW